MDQTRSAFREPLSAALEHALDHLAPTRELSVAATASLESLRAKLCFSLPEAGTDGARVVDELVSAVAGGIINSAGPRFFGWVIGGSLPAALAADWLTSAWDQNAGLYACSPAAAIVEEAAGQWLKELLLLPATASFALVTGAQMAHVTCLSGSPPIRILTSTEKHGTIVRAVRLLGLGEKNLISLQADPGGRLPAETLANALQENSTIPTVVVLQAGDLNIGAFDDFQTLIPIAKKHGAWVHVDGAFGLWAAASARYRHLLAGAGQADSWTTDGHKWLNVPYDCGYAFVADREAHRASLSHRAAYLTHDADARDQMDWTPEYSRRGRGFATYAALRQLGKAGVEALIDRTCRHTHELVTRMGSLPGAEMLWEPQINQGLVRFHDPRDGATDADHDVFTDRIMAAILASGEAFFTGTTWRGRRAMRVSVCNWQTSAEDIERVVNCVAITLKGPN
jgi:aromatic-L-amino-acid decarboxylase